LGCARCLRGRGGGAAASGPALQGFGRLSRSLARSLSLSRSVSQDCQEWCTRPTFITGQSRQDVSRSQTQASARRRPDSGSESLARGRLPPPGQGPRPSRPRHCWRDGIQKVRSHKVTKKKATGARKRIWRCSTPWKLYVPEVNCTSGALAPAFVMEHALCVSNMHLIARDMQFCSPTCMFCVEHAL
jgi:hypothetical protein